MPEYDNRPEGDQNIIDASNLLAEPFKDVPVEDLCNLILNPESPLVSPWNSEQKIEAAIEAAFAECGLSEIQLWERASRYSTMRGTGSISLEQVQSVLSGNVDTSDCDTWYTIAQVLGIDVGKY